MEALAHPLDERRDPTERSGEVSEHRAKPVTERRRREVEHGGAEGYSKVASNQGGDKRSDVKPSGKRVMTVDMGDLLYEGKYGNCMEKS